MFRKLWKKRLAAVAFVAALAITGAAVAYFTGGSGSVTGSGTVGASSALGVTTGTPTWSGSLTALYPGATNNTQFLPFTVTNNGNGRQSLTTMTASALPGSSNPANAETAAGTPTSRVPRQLVHRRGRRVKSGPALDPRARRHVHRQDRPDHAGQRHQPEPLPERSPCGHDHGLLATGPGSPGVKEDCAGSPGGSLNAERAHTTVNQVLGRRPVPQAAHRRLRRRMLLAAFIPAPASAYFTRRLRVRRGSTTVGALPATSRDRNRRRRHRHAHVDCRSARRPARTSATTSRGRGRGRRKLSELGRRRHSHHELHRFRSEQGQLQLHRHRDLAVVDLDERRGAGERPVRPADAVRRERAGERHRRHGVLGDPDRAGRGRKHGRRVHRLAGDRLLGSVELAGRDRPGLSGVGGFSSGVGTASVTLVRRPEHDVDRRPGRRDREPRARLRWGPAPITRSGPARRRRRPPAPRSA